MTDPCVSVVSWQCCMKTEPAWATAARTAFIMPADWMTSPSSLNATAPARGTSRTRPSARPAGPSSPRRRENPAVPGLARPLADEPQDLGRVHARGGVGHAADGREPARDRGPRAGGDRLLVLAPGLAEVHVRVDQPRADDRARGVDDPVGVRTVEIGPDGGDPPAADRDIGGAVEARGGVDDPPAGDEDGFGGWGGAHACRVAGSGLSLRRAAGPGPARDNPRGVAQLG
jgi:hypothetical protein